MGGLAAGGDLRSRLEADAAGRRTADEPLSLLDPDPGVHDRYLQGPLRARLLAARQPRAGLGADARSPTRLDNCGYGPRAARWRSSSATRSLVCIAAIRSCRGCEPDSSISTTRSGDTSPARRSMTIPTSSRT